MKEKRDKENENMKKLIAGLLMAVMVTGTLAGCGTATKDGASTQETGSKNNSNTSSFDTAGYISVISREDGSGTRGAFIELFGIEEKDEAGNKTDHTTEEAVIANKTDVMLTSVAGDENAIGYASLGSMNDSIKGLKINGAEATIENIKSGSYEIARPFNIATKTEGVSEAAQDFINYILSAQGQKVAEENGFIQIVEEAKNFKGTQPSGKIVVAGSSSVSPVMEKLKEAYQVVNPNATIEIQTSDSSTGMQAAMDGTCDIGMASRELKDTELEKLTATSIALDGIVVIVNKANPIEELTTEQVKNIFTGALTKWDLQ